MERSAGRAFLALADLAWIAEHDAPAEGAHARAIGAGTAWVARLGGRTIGFLTAHAGDGVLHVAELAVCHDHQQRGIGSALMAAAVGEATIRRARAVTLTTFHDVPWNAPYYARLGFAVVRRGQLDGRLSAILDGESDAGLPRRRRCAMSLAIAP